MIQAATAVIVAKKEADRRTLRTEFDRDHAGKISRGRMVLMEASAVFDWCRRCHRHLRPRKNGEKCPNAHASSGH